MVTKDEYITRGMLLGMVYQEITHAYAPLPGGPVPWHGLNSIWLDADTLEPVDHEARKERRMAKGYGS